MDPQAQMPWQTTGQNALGSTSSGSGYDWGSAMQGGLLAGFLPSMFGGGQDPSQYSGQIPGTITGYLGPYAQMGQGLIPQVTQGYQAEMDPSQFLGQMGQGFQTDPGYQFQLNQALQGANQAAAAGGMAGSPQSQQFGAGIAENMANQQYQQYLKNAMGAYQSGLGGLGGLEQQGFGAAGDISSGLSSYLQSQANLAQAQNQQADKEAGSFMGNIGTAIASFL